MDYIVNYNVSNVNIHCVIQEKDAIIGRQQKEIEELHKTNQLLAKEIDKLKTDLDLQKKLSESLEKFKYSLERNVAVLKDIDRNRWNVSDAESETRIWEHEYLMVRRMLDKREREEQAILLANTALNSMNANPELINGLNNSQNSAQTPKQTPHRRSAPKPKIGEDGMAIKRYVCDYPNCEYRSNWAHDLKGHKRKHTGEKPYTCGWLNCNKSFRDLRDLKRHQRAHTGDKRYSCDWPGCDYRSTDVANLAKHKRTHTGEKPYKCDWAGCEASFADGSHLRRHQKKHENQVSRLTKTATTKKRQTTPKSSPVVKTRQQPGRKAKGSNAAHIPLEVKLRVVEEDGSGLKSNQTNENNNSIEIQENRETINNSMEELNRTDINSNTIEERVGTDVNLNSIPETNNSCVDSDIMSESNGNSSANKESNRTDLSSDLIDGQNSTLMKVNLINDNNRRLIISNVIGVESQSNPIVITSAMIGETNRTVNSSPLRESGDKQPIVRYPEVIIANTNSDKESNR